MLGLARKCVSSLTIRSAGLSRLSRLSGGPRNSLLRTKPSMAIPKPNVRQTAPKHSPDGPTAPPTTTNSRPPVQANIRSRSFPRLFRQRTLARTLRSLRRRRVARKPISPKPNHRNYFPRGSFTSRLIKVMLWVLASSARSLGYFVTPDGYVRMRDVLSLPWFRRLRKPTLRKVFTSKFRAYFKITVMPDVVSGTMEDTLWIRSARGCKIEGVDFWNTQVRNMSKLPLVVYTTTFNEWDYIRQNGIPPDQRDKCIHLSEDAGGDVLAKFTLPEQDSLAITLDAKKAHEAGVLFFRTQSGELLATPARGGHIPLTAFKAAVLLQMKRKVRHDKKPENR